MRTESCRICGSQVIPSPDHIDACIVCGEPQKLLCPKCNEKSLVQVHSHSHKQSLLVEPLVAYNKFRGGRN